MAAFSYNRLPYNDQEWRDICPVAVTIVIISPHKEIVANREFEMADPPSSPKNYQLCHRDSAVFQNDHEGEKKELEKWDKSWKKNKDGD